MATAVQTVGTKQEAPKEPKTFTVTLVDEAGTSLRVRAVRTKAGYRTEVIHRVAKGKGVRGATAEHVSLAEARAAVERAAGAAEKAGWRRRESRGGGFVRPADAFSLTNLPKPGRAAKK